MAIAPLNLPAGAGLDYASGDVRHFSQGDAVNVPGLTNPTRNLAERDNKIAEKVNELVSAVNNQEQFVPLPLIRTIVPSNEEVAISNYRIAPGFEARVLNAAISTVPASTSVQLNVYYSASFGGSTGTSVISVTPGAEFTGDVNFYQEGEFILSIKNTGGSSLEVIASVMLTMRPIGAEGTLLVGSVIEGRQGRVGRIGPPGRQGIPGTGGAGSPGMNWRASWTNGVVYNKNDVASYSYSGTYGSWICRVGHTASLGVNDPQVDTVTWNPVAFGILGQTGTDGSSGTVGPIGPSGGTPNYKTTVVYGTLVTGADWSNIALDGYWTQTFSPGSTYNNIPLIEVKIESGTANPGYQRAATILGGQVRVAFAGNGTFTLPKSAYGAAVDYLNTRCALIASPNGTIDSGTQTITCVPTSTDSYVLKNLNPSPIATQVTVSGIQTY